MKISPIEIRQKSFEKNFRGYDKEEVDAFLLSLSQEWERVMDESKELKFKLQMADKEVQKLREVESTLYKTLKTAEDTGANIVGQANKSAELLTKEAQINSEAILNEARVRAKNTQEEAEEKAKNALFEAQKRLNEISLEIKTLEAGKQNLVQELKRLGSEILERANRISTSLTLPEPPQLLVKEDPLPPVLKEEPSPSLPQDLQETEGLQAEEPEAIEPAEPISIPVPEAMEQAPITQSKKTSTSFFDQLN